MTDYNPTDLAARLKSGLLSFPVTHFGADLAFDEDAYRKHLAWLAEYPVAGLFAAGEACGGLFYTDYPGGAALMRSALFGRAAGWSAAAEEASR